VRVPSETAVTSPGSPIRRYQIWILATIAFLIVALIVVQGIANLFTNYLWYRSESFSDVWRAMTLTRVELGAFFIGVFFIACWVSLLVVDRVAPRALFMSPEQEFVRRYQATVGRHRFAVRTVVSLFLALIMGSGVGGQWQHWLLFLHGGSFGITDPQFHKDVGYYVFKLPFLSFLVDWTQVALVLLAIVCVLAYYLNGGLRFSGPSPRVDPRATSHFSVIFAALALLRAAGYYYVDRYALDLSPTGVVQGTGGSGGAAGAGFTAIHVRLPALNLLAIVALAAFVMFVYNVYARNWMLPAVAAGLWAFLGIVTAVIFPAVVQSFEVNPSASSVEATYISRNMIATQAAYGLTPSASSPSGIKQQTFAGNDDATSGVLTEDQASLEDVDLWDPTIAAQTYQTLQRSRGFYSINGVSFDRYDLATGPNNSSQLTPVVLGVREISSGNLPTQTWVNTHLVYTHGYGVVMAPANTTTNTPSFDIDDVPIHDSSGAPGLESADVYYGLGETGYVVVDSNQAEFDYQSASGPVNNSYTGTGGIKIGSIWQKAAFALRFHDFNLLVSKLVTPHSRIMFNQDVRTIVQNVAPFLQIDSNPYPVIDDGHIEWIVDAYTTTSNYPYSQPVVSGSGLQGGFNYIRNSVKAVVDAYDGKVTLYAVDPTDPILRAWERTFPGMFHPLSAMSPILRDHLRYPQSLLAAEASMFGRYHIPANEPLEFFEGTAAWTQAETGIGNAAAVVRPVYQLLALPGQSSPSFNAFVPLVPFSNSGTAQNLSAFLVANCTAADYGKLTAYEIPQGRVPVAGPAIANAAIAANQTVSEKVTLLDQHGSRAVFGPTLMIPIDDSLVYLRALFVSSASNAYPQFTDVVVSYGDKVAISKTLLGQGGALEGVFGAAVSTIGTNTNTNIPQRIANEIDEADAAEARAQTELKAGNFGEFGADLQLVAKYLSEAKTQLAMLKKDAAGSHSSSIPSSSSSSVSSGA
jgi:uncharacterized membrane protein (UPF0182 family)